MLKTESSRIDAHVQLDKYSSTGAKGLQPSQFQQMSDLYQKLQELLLRNSSNILVLS